MNHLTKKIISSFHLFGVILLIGIAAFFAVLGFYTFYSALNHIFEYGIEHKFLLQEMFHILLYIELIAAIKIYFQNKHHFPLRFFIYIGITDITREIIISLDKPQHILFLSIGVLILIGGLAALEYKNKFLKTKKDSLDNFEI